MKLQERAQENKNLRNEKKKIDSGFQTRKNKYYIK